MYSFYGPHTEPDGINNFAGFVEFHRRLRPAWSLVTQNYAKLKILKEVHPGGNYIWRVQPDNHNHLAIPKDGNGNYIASVFFDRMDAAAGGKVDSDVYMHVVNEAFLLEAVDLNIAVAEEAIRTNRRVALVGLATGQPGDLSELRHPKVIKLLRLAHEHPENIVIVLHEYGGRDLFNEAFNNVPTSVVPDNFTLWYVGRFRFWEDVCEEHGFHNVRIVIGEFGTDHLDDPNLNNPDRPGGPLMDPRILDRRNTPGIAPNPHWGIFNLRNHTRNRYGMPFYDAVIQQMIAAYKYIYAPSKHVEGVCWFIVGAMNRIAWEFFDLQRHPDLMDKWLLNRDEWLIEPWEASDPPEDDDDEPDDPPVVEPPDPYDRHMVKIVSLPPNYTYMNFRESPFGPFVAEPIILPGTNLCFVGQAKAQGGVNWQKVWLADYNRYLWVQLVPGLVWEILPNCDISIFSDTEVMKDFLRRAKDGRYG